MSEYCYHPSLGLVCDEDGILHICDGQNNEVTISLSDINTSRLRHVNSGVEWFANGTINIGDNKTMRLKLNENGYSYTLVITDGETTVAKSLSNRKILKLLRFFKSAVNGNKT